MKLYKIVYDNGYGIQEEQLIITDAYPGNKRVIKFINMYKFCGHEMSDKDYKEFVVDAGNYFPYLIIDIEELEFINISKK